MALKDNCTLNSSARKSKICIVTTSLMIVRFFLTTHIFELSKLYQVTLVVNVDDAEDLKRMNLPAEVVHMPIHRQINLFGDLIALFKLIVFFAKSDFSVVHTVAPKAGLLGILAARFVGVPKRLHVFQGEVWLNRKGIMRFVLKNLDRLVSLCATNLLVVSKSEREFLIEQKIISVSKSMVLGDGSICGVNTERFKFDQFARTQLRSECGISPSEVVLLFVGRLTRDKGILELLDAFKILEDRTVHLFIVGPDEENIGASIASLQEDVRKRVHMFAYTETPQIFMSAADVLVLPSHREGFGLVIIEAAAVGIPAIGSRIYGITDAIVDGQTGLLFEVKNSEDLSQKVKKLVFNKDLRLAMGAAAQYRCTKLFLQRDVVEANIKYYKDILECG